MDFVFLLSLVSAPEDLSTVPDLPPVFSALDRKMRDAEDTGSLELLSCKQKKKQSDVDVADGSFSSTDKEVISRKNKAWQWFQGDVGGHKEKPPIGHSGVFRNTV